MSKSAPPIRVAFALPSIVVPRRLPLPEPGSKWVVGPVNWTDQPVIVTSSLSPTEIAIPRAVLHFFQWACD